MSAIKHALLITLLAGSVAACTSGPSKKEESASLLGAIKRGEQIEAEAAQPVKTEGVPAPTVKALNSDQEKQAKKAEPDFQKALAAMQAGQDSLALQLFRDLEQKYPLLSGPYLNEAKILVKQKKFDDAKNQLMKAASLHPQNPYIYNELGLVQRELGQFQDAMQSYQKALQIAPNYALAHYNLGILADLYLQNYTLALDQYKAYQSLLPEPDKKVAGWIKDLERRVKS
ncbi:MAG TPA: tetratricopeptide repeat protein [Pseudomonadales bacterium]|nr:tetratricopeptide repeat protein [Pseudomonadales bacterium]